jgi:hypothetical protein
MSATMPPLTDDVKRKGGDYFGVRAARRADNPSASGPDTR